MIFYRHPRPDVPTGLCYGQLDVGIHPDAQGSIKKACTTAPPISAIISSPSKRALALAQPLATATGAKLIPDPRWMEMNFGAWEGLLWPEINRDESDPWAADPMNQCPPGGEAFSQVIARVQNALAEHPKDTAVVAHAGPIRAARMLLTNTSFETAFAEPIPFATPIEFSELKAA